ncbi:MAG: hypothetical protein M3Q23_02730 [Actinomycetota bacterium]|nr:hypothetical protein [Actinomycetota bacterium]
MGSRYVFTFVVVGRYPARIKGNQPALTINMLAGTENHETYCGTLTMSEDEWDTFFWGLKESLGDRVRVNDQAADTEEEKERRREAI